MRAGIDKRLRARGPEPPAGRRRRRPSGTRPSQPGPRRPTGSPREIAGRIARGAAPGDHAVLVRSNAEADAVLRSLNVAGHPAGASRGRRGCTPGRRSGCCIAFLRAVADLRSSVDLYALAASDVYGLGGRGPDRRSRPLPGGGTGPLWEVLEEARSPARRSSASRLATRSAVKRLVADLRRYGELAHARPAGEVLYAFLKGSGLLARLAAATRGPAADEALQNIARFFDIDPRRSPRLLADDRAAFVVGHLRTLIEAGDDPPSAELDPAPTRSPS